jgi:hypothetical protein
MDTQAKLATLKRAAQDMRSGEDLLALLLGLIDTISELEAKQSAAPAAPSAAMQSAPPEPLTEAEEDAQFRKFLTENLRDADPDDSFDISNLVFPDDDDDKKTSGN